MRIRDAAAQTRIVFAGDAKPMGTATKSQMMARVRISELDALQIVMSLSGMSGLQSDSMGGTEA
jgi:hypothetical protein